MSRRTSHQLVAFVGELLLKEVATLLGDVGIPVMVLKGVLLQKTVYADRPNVRNISDLDVLIPSGELRRAHGVLSRAGFVAEPGFFSRTGCTYRTRWSLPLDLHASLYARWMFRVRSDALFARGRRDESLYGVAVYLPHPEDLYAHLVGHFAKGRLSRDHPNLGDLAAVARYHALDARRVARVLEEGGLARAAQYALALSAEQLGDGFAREVLGHLPDDPLGRLWGRAADRALAGERTPWLAQVAAAHLLNASLPRAALSFTDNTVRWLGKRSGLAGRPPEI